MTYLQALSEITSELKWYIGSPYSQPTASRIAKRIREGNVTINKRNEFLNAFGYVEREGEWIKTKVQTGYKTK
jgi:hypothetical protein